MRRKNSIKLVCEYCKLEHESWVHNKKYCDSCRQLGIYKKNCNHCNLEFRTNRHNVKYCTPCSSDNLFLRGKKRPKSVVEKVEMSRKKWLRSDAAREHYKRLGSFNSKNLKKHFSTNKGKEQIKQAAKKQSKAMREKIANEEFTPPITNSFTHWNAQIFIEGEIKKFRSSWEACFWLSNQHLEYETIRVPRRTGGSIIADFVDTEKSIIYEIKPRSFWNKQQEKIDDLIDYCLKNGYIFKWINEDNILDYVHRKDFDSKNLPQYEKMIDGIKTNKN